MKTITVLNSRGDTVVKFDEVTGKAEAEALALFKRLMRSGHAAFKVNRANGLPDERVAEFYALEQDTLIVPNVVGG